MGSQVSCFVGGASEYTWKTIPLSNKCFCFPVCLLADLRSSAKTVSSSLNSEGVWLLFLFRLMQAQGRQEDEGGKAISLQLEENQKHGCEALGCFAHGPVFPTPGRFQSPQPTCRTDCKPPQNARPHQVPSR